MPLTLSEHRRPPCPPATGHAGPPTLASPPPPPHNCNPPIAQTPARGTFTSPGILDVVDIITAWHAGHLEFRLGVPSKTDPTASFDTQPNGPNPLTQAKLNEYVLEIDESTPNYPAILNYQGMKGIGTWDGNGGRYKCPHSGGPPGGDVPTKANGYSKGYSV